MHNYSISVFPSSTSRQPLVGNKYWIYLWKSSYRQSCEWPGEAQRGPLGISACVCVRQQRSPHVLPPQHRFHCFCATALHEASVLPRVSCLALRLLSPACGAPLRLSKPSSLLAFKCGSQRRSWHLPQSAPRPSPAAAPQHLHLLARHQAHRLP